MNVAMLYLNGSAEDLGKHLGCFMIVSLSVMSFYMPVCERQRSDVILLVLFTEYHVVKEL